MIATQLAPGTSWSGENNRPQPYRNSRRLCFMYKESGGVVSLTASEVACQRGIPPPPPMLAFNATSTGEYLLLSFATSLLRILKVSVLPCRGRVSAAMNLTVLFRNYRRSANLPSFEHFVSRFRGCSPPPSNGGALSKKLGHFRGARSSLDSIFSYDSVL